MTSNLADSVEELRDEVLDIPEPGRETAPGAELFDTIVRALRTGMWSPESDRALQDAVSRRLAFGDSELSVLASHNSVCDRLMVACHRALGTASDEIVVSQITAHVAAAGSRLVVEAALGRANRERAARVREALAKNRLRQVLRQQRDELDKLRKA